MAKTTPCDHKFVDSSKCLKCGWEPPADRVPLMAALASMPDEAFGWLLLTLCDLPLSTGRGQVWPDGLGGFMDASRVAIEKVRAEARKLAGVDPADDPKPTPKPLKMKVTRSKTIEE